MRSIAIACIVFLHAVDPTPPVCTSTPDDITREIGLRDGGATVGYQEPTATDDCGPAILQSRSHAPGDFFPSGQTTVSYVFVDGSGNTVTCTFNIFVDEG